MQKNYNYYKQILADASLPLCFLDIDHLKENIQQIKSRVSNSKTVRIASKSIRSVEVLKLILESDKKLFKGIMCYSIAEAVFLSQKGFDDLLVAYPGMQKKMIEDVCIELQKGKKIVLMTDSKEHIDAISSVAKNHKIAVPICIDIDMSSEFTGLHFGVWRSSLFNKIQVMDFVDYIRLNSNVKLEGVMGYEAQIAGIADNVPGQIIMNTIIRWLKKISRKEINKRREEIVKSIRAKGINLQFVNGGGTGTIEETSAENEITEIAVGSALYSPLLFDNYFNFKHLPALAFAIEIARNPKPGIYTCNGGGYIASGSAGKEKLPQPYLPKGLELLKNEGAGEVQTPMKFSGKEPIKIGDPVFMRHAKAGELCEHFNELLLISDTKIIGKALTYRGEGKSFL
jgi:D-serine deaminase-like pyridoxal phosphate-dependent protein